MPSEVADYYNLSYETVAVDKNHSVVVPSWYWEESWIVLDDYEVTGESESKGMQERTLSGSPYRSPSPPF
jgi:hypothetical protein